MNLIMLCYNFMRTKNILGFAGMLKALTNWQPNYKKIVCALKTAFIKTISSSNKEPAFFFKQRMVFLKAC